MLPIGVLLLLNLHGYWLVGENMDASQLATAHLIGAAGVANLIVGLILSVLTAHLRRRHASWLSQPSGWIVPATALVVPAAYLWFADFSANALLPRSVTTWIYPTDGFLLHQFAFAMLPLALGGAA